MNPKPRRMGALALVFALAMSQVTPAQAEPRPGVVRGLDLSSPEAAIRSLADAWADADFFVVYLSLDPAMRVRFGRSLSRLDFASVLGAETSREMFDRSLAHTVDSRPDGDGTMVVDLFAHFDGLMRVAREDGLLPYGQAFATGIGDVVFEGDGATARAPIETGDSGAMLVLRRSPGGLWRVMGFANAPSLPSFWIAEDE